MDGISFTAPDAPGGSRLDVAWADFCDQNGVPAGSRLNGAAVARAVAGNPREMEAHASAGLILRTIVDAIGIEPAAERLLPVVLAFIDALPDAVLSKMLASMAAAERWGFIRATTPVFPATSILKLARAAATAFGEPLSEPLLRLLAKLRAESETQQADVRARAEDSFRSLVLDLIEGWSRDAITATGGFNALFQQGEESRTNRLTPEPARIVQLSIESGAIGNVVWGAVAKQAQTEEGMRELFGMLKRAPAESRAAALMIDHIATPSRLSALLREDPVDFDLLDTIIARMGINAARPLIDELAEAKSRSTRRAIMDRLVKLGPDICPIVIERLDDKRWYVVRNMLSLLREADCPTQGIPLDRFRDHEDARIRRETLQLQLEAPASREAALLQAFQDNDKSVLRSALQAARATLPDSVVPTLAKRVTEPNYPPEFRVMSLFLLGRSSSVAALETLLAFVQGGSSLFGKPKLAPKSPEMLAALGGLARSWPNERRAAVLLDIARKSKDDQILNALNVTAGSQ